MLACCLAPMRSWTRWLQAFMLLACLTPRPGQADEPLRLKVIGGLADVSQFVRYEEPFWRRRLSELTNGKVVGEIAAFDRAGFRA